MYTYLRQNELNISSKSGDELPVLRVQSIWQRNHTLLGLIMSSVKIDLSTLKCGLRSRERRHCTYERKHSSELCSGNNKAHLGHLHRAGHRGCVAAMDRENIYKVRWSTAPSVKPRLISNTRHLGHHSKVRESLFLPSTSYHVMKVQALSL